MSDAPLSGDAVRIMRKRLGWSHPDFARLLNVSASSVQRWESQRDKTVTADPYCHGLLRILASVLDTAPDATDVLGRMREEKPPRALFALLGLHFGDTPWVLTPVVVDNRQPIDLDAAAVDVKPRRKK